MLEIRLPDRPTIQLNTLLCDINGTLALDGHLIDGVKEAVEGLKTSLEIHLLSADTTGCAAEIAAILGVDLKVIEPGKEAKQKKRVLEHLGRKHTAAIGQGANDELMLKKAALGICVLSKEGSAVDTFKAADIVVPDIATAFDLLNHPLRIVATLRR